MPSINVLDGFTSKLCANCFHLLDEHARKKCLYGPKSFTPFPARPLTSDDWLRYVAAACRHFNTVRQMLMLKYSPSELDAMGNPHEDKEALIAWLSRPD